MILMGPWTEFYFFAKSIPLLICAVIAVIVIGFMVVFWFLNKLESFTKRIHAKKAKAEEDTKDYVHIVGEEIKNGTDENLSESESNEGNKAP